MSTGTTPGGEEKELIKGYDPVKEPDSAIGLVQEKPKNEPSKDRDSSETATREPSWTDKSDVLKQQTHKQFTFVNPPPNLPLSNPVPRTSSTHHYPQPPPLNLNPVGNPQGYPPVNLQSRNFPSGPGTPPPNTGYPQPNWLRPRPPSQFREDQQSPYVQQGVPSKPVIARPSGWSILRERFPSEIKNPGPYAGNFQVPGGRQLQPNYDSSNLRMQQSPGYAYPRPDRPPSSQGMNSPSGPQDPNQPYSPVPGQIPPGDRKMYMQRSDSMIRQQQPMGMGMMRPSEGKAPMPMVRPREPGEEGQELPRAYIAARPPGVRGLPNMPNMPGSPQSGIRSNPPQMSMDGRTTPIENRPLPAGMPPRPMMRPMAPSQFAGPHPQSPQMMGNRPPNFGGMREEPYHGLPAEAGHDNKYDIPRQNAYPPRPPSRSSESGHVLTSESPQLAQHEAISVEKNETILEEANKSKSPQVENFEPKPNLIKTDSKTNIIPQNELKTDESFSPDASQTKQSDHKQPDYEPQGQKTPDNKPPNHEPPDDKPPDYKPPDNKPPEDDKKNPVKRKDSILIPSEIKMNVTHQEKSKSNAPSSEKVKTPTSLKDSGRRDINGDPSSGHHVKFPPNLEKIRNDSSPSSGSKPAQRPKGELTTNAKRPTSVNQEKRTKKDEPLGKKDRASSKEDLKPAKSPSLPNGSPVRPENHLRSSMTSPEPQGEKKKVPMNKIHVGAAPSPNLKCIKSKIGSLENKTHTPGGGNIKIESKKLDFSKAQPKIAAKNDTYSPGGGEKKIQHQKLQWHAKPKVGSLDNANHKPGGGDKKIESLKLDFKDKAKPKVGSKDNIKHIAGGGNVKIEEQKVEIKAQSKIGSFENVKHKPGGGDKKIFDDKKYIRQVSEIYSETLSASNSQGNVNEISPSSSRSKSLDRLKLTPISKPSVFQAGEINTEAKPTDQNYNQVNAAKPPSGKSKKTDSE